LHLIRDFFLIILNALTEVKILRLNSPRPDLSNLSSLLGNEHPDILEKKNHI